MMDRLLTPKENNIIAAVQKLATKGVHHNFKKCSDVIAFNSELSNKMFRSITETPDMKVSYNCGHSYENKLGTVTDYTIFDINDILAWLDSSCSGYYVLVDNNVFFELPEDKTSFILKFSDN